MNEQLREQIEFLKGRNSELSAQLKARAQTQMQNSSGENLREKEELNLLREQVHKLAEETSSFHDKLGAAERELIGERHKTRVAAYDEELRTVKNHNNMYRASAFSTIDVHISVTRRWWQVAAAQSHSAGANQRIGQHHFRSPSFHRYRRERAQLPVHAG